MLPVALLMVACSASEPTIEPSGQATLLKSEPRVDADRCVVCNPRAERHPNAEAD